ncbi:nicotinate-nucleotide--dimethylbenzimidazole phosphoribosyltransferase [Desulfofustis glycolicus]|uniref:Nicotinate-nucleotide--dimethylbenzimidazole phosphoribosyltransferase n=1 Tax=Desulfofustis glycolicus DSM 9705 TaxID=1121409 RepID=A0A1M5WWK5_9BACT|nr:nicotinate-nucleotide--dimethylbenzimidazole phosphoribosyltransferase [Desulfofustis glycolicus]MCB2214502.1 nicotinate-nucleotide--dimethylbenzimidazole phosphoribosyltransferase [Desulfobulbaceae bacterium]SHH91977.1 nicotinate-nucleotide-dimethylbenzimidazole phosphoribosyltransferase [Desulfofustis glycolicus DSM 9705]
MKLLEKTCRDIFPQDSEMRAAAKARLDQLALPHWALGDLMDLAIELAGMTRSMSPSFKRKAVVTMAGDHGVVAEGVSKFPQEVTPQMVANFVNGGAGINALARQVGAEVLVVDMGVNSDLSALSAAGKIIDKKVGPGTNNIARGPAMSIAAARRAVEAGIEVAQSLREYDLLGTGDMGIGNTTPSSAIAAVLTGRPVEEVTGRGTGLNDEQYRRKINVLEQILQVNRPDPSNGLEVLAAIGGFEIGGIAGLIIGAAAQRQPVLVDGLISTAGALIAYRIEPFVRDYIICAHRSVEPGHKYMQEMLGWPRPLLDLNLRLGEGTGAALAMNIVEAARAVLVDIATFAEAAVAQADK